jgi:hypothetical protein
LAKGMLVTIVVDTMPSGRAPAPLLARIAHLAGWLLVAAALSALGLELAQAFFRGAYQPIAAGELWFRLDVTSLNLVQAITQRYLHPSLWDPIVATILQWPAWSLLGGPGAALVLAFPLRRGA